MVVKCIKATEQLDERVLDTLTKEVKDTFVQVNNSSMKEVKGIVFIFFVYLPPFQESCIQRDA
jgi:hypothetical protein